MKGIVLAGGLGTRLYPLTHVTNKHLLPIYDQPMVFYPIHTLVRAGITDVLVITSGPHVGHFLSVLKNGKELGLEHLEYAYQEKPDGGIADALSIAEDFSDGQPVAVILGDNTTDADIGKTVSSFTEGATIFLKEVTDPQRFGVAVFDAKDKQKIVNIEEKPKKPQSNMAVTGVYIYDPNVFTYMKTIKPSWRNQLEITDINNKYIEQGRMHWAVLDGYWHDCGTFSSLYAANKYWADKREASSK